MRRTTLFCVAVGLTCALAACEDQTLAALPSNDSGVHDAGSKDTGTLPDTGTNSLEPCLDRPSDLVRPSDRLPCDMLPPNFPD
jgi:hypothetical protein